MSRMYLIFTLVMLPVYAAMAYVFLFTDMFSDIIQGGSRKVLGIFAAVYTIFRAYMLYRARKNASAG